METGTTSHLDRMNLTKRLDEFIKPFFIDAGFAICDFGYAVTLRNQPSMSARMKRLEVKKSDAALMAKFSPDFIVIRNGRNRRLFFMETKTSITPIFFDSYIEKLRTEAKLPKLRREDIGEIEREAWDTYNIHYNPKEIVIVLACPYNPNLILAEWVDKILCFHRFKKDTNTEAGGSQTPHVNIHLGIMRPLCSFLKEEFGIKINEAFYKEITDFIKKWGLNKPAGRVNWAQFNSCVSKLRATCSWIQYRLPKDKDQSLLDRYR